MTTSCMGPCSVSIQTCTRQSWGVALLRYPPVGGILHSPRKSHAQQHHRVRRHARVLATAEASSQAPSAPLTVWLQRTVELPPLPRGCHIITRKLLQQLPELAEMEVGLCNLFLQHTSASLTLNENASPDVPLDLNDELDRIVPEGRHFRHLDEGSDDCPAHVKSSLMGASLTLPIQHGRLALGTWQGVYLNEHRNYGGPRRIVITVQGQRRADGRKYGTAAR